MAYVAPITRSTGDLITAAIWNQDAVDNMIAVKAQLDVSTSYARAFYIATQSIPQGVITALALSAGSTLWSSANGTWFDSANNTRLLIPETGAYEFNYAAGLSGNTAAFNWQMWLRKNGAITISNSISLLHKPGSAGSADYFPIFRNEIHDLDAGDYIEILVYQAFTTGISVFHTEFNVMGI